MRPCIAFLANAEAEYLTHKAVADLFAQGADAFRTALSGFDAVFIHPFPNGFAVPVPVFEDLRAANDRAFFIPVVDFPAFHPDITYAFDRQGRLVRGPMGPYNSNLVLYAFLAGLEAKDALSLFTSEVFQAAGYLDGWNYCQSALLNRGSDIGFPLESMLAAWTRRGCFMHTINHPKLFVIEDIARAALKRAGIRCRPESCVDYVNDSLLYSVWPVYPEIAAEYSLSGGYAFRRQPNMAPARASNGQYLDLEAFVYESYASYTALERGAIVAPAKIAQWLTNQRLGRLQGPARGLSDAAPALAAPDHGDPSTTEDYPPAPGPDNQTGVRRWIGNRVRSFMR